MSFLRGLLMARSHLAFLMGLGLALSIVWKVSPQSNPGTASRGAGSGENGETMATSGSSRAPSGKEQGTGAAGTGEKASTQPEAVDFASRLKVDAPPTLRPVGEKLTAEELEWARAAWKYFENNYQPSTGLVNSVDNYQSTTLWDLGSYATGLIAARRLDLIDEKTFDQRLRGLLQSLEKLPLVDGKLPNKAYNTLTLQMVDYNNQPAPTGIGWSALDIARIGVPFQVLVWAYPQYNQQVRQILSAWKLGEVIKAGELQGAQRNPDGTLELVQEGRFGYEQYGARSLSLLGLDVSLALRYDRNIAFTRVSGQPIAYDARMPDAHAGTHNAVLSEPYILEGIEFGLDENTLPLAQSVFAAQRSRHRETGVLTAVSEDNIDKAPYFVYNSVLNAGKPWAAFSPDGKDADAFRTLSTKAAMGWAYLLQDEYSDRLKGAMTGLYDPQRGWYSGRYERDGALNSAITSNTNGIVLELLLFKAQGPLLALARAK